jgi:hypothetical protein
MAGQMALGDNTRSQGSEPAGRFRPPVCRTIGERDLHRERQAKEEAQAREAESKAVLEFVEKRVFAAARPGFGCRS